MDCLDRIPGDQRSRCSRCRTPTSHGRTCAPCRDQTPLQGIFSVGTYQQEILRTAVHALKFEGVRDLAALLSLLLARALVGALGGSAAEFTLVPLPLHRRKERTRGFNQAQLLSDETARRVGIPCLPLLVRTRWTPPQTSIDSGVPEARSENVSDVFAIAPGAPQPLPSSIVIVDDVATTGATLEASARVLYDHGARTIWGAVICRG